METSNQVLPEILRKLGFSTFEDDHCLELKFNGYGVARFNSIVSKETIIEEAAKYYVKLANQKVGRLARC